MFYILVFSILFVVILRCVRAGRTITANSVKGRHRFTLINRELNYVFGLPGSGKSTLLAAVAQACFDLGIPCFSNFPIEHAYKFEGFEVSYPMGSVFLFDEVYDLVGSGTNKGILPTDTTMFFKEFRHSMYTIWACSQESDDVARRIRGIVTSAYVMRNSVSDVSVLSPAIISEVKNEFGEKFELKNQSKFFSFFTDLRLKRRDFYDNFDSYIRRSYDKSCKYKSW